MAGDRNSTAARSHLFDADEPSSPEYTNTHTYIRLINAFDYSVLLIYLFFSFPSDGFLHSYYAFGFRVCETMKKNAVYLLTSRSLPSTRISGRSSTFILLLKGFAGFFSKREINCARDSRLGICKI
ncbi:uncharacterized protein LOC135160705 [Diachasmimorpha longicaudata]|uniref:uncharacterized protein LOC135160705 n=1 Tax=Diachasmimorpha longicaudata TaxID=58733 RepID=UPI0030B88895